MRLPDSNDLHTFCQVDGWEASRKTKHVIYRKVLATGDVLAALVSHGNKQIHDADLFARICRDELQCTPTQFWDAVDHRRPVPRPQPDEPVSDDPIPYGLYKALEAQGHRAERLAQLRTKAEALELLKDSGA